MEKRRPLQLRQQMAAANTQHHRPRHLHGIVGRGIYATTTAAIPIQHNEHQENEAHEIPADPSASDNDEVGDKNAKASNDDVTCQKQKSSGNNFPNESGNSDREHATNNNGDGTDYLEQGGNVENEGNYSSAYTNNTPQISSSPTTT
jgi:hypothetical protein